MVASSVGAAAIGMDTFARRASRNGHRGQMYSPCPTNSGPDKSSKCAAIRIENTHTHKPRQQPSAARTSSRDFSAAVKPILDRFSYSAAPPEYTGFELFCWSWTDRSSGAFSGVPADVPSIVSRAASRPPTPVLEKAISQSLHPLLGTRLPIEADLDDDHDDDDNDDDDHDRRS